LGEIVQDAPAGILEAVNVSVGKELFCYA